MERVLKNYSATLDLTGWYDLRVFSDGTTEKIDFTDDIGNIDISERERIYLISYLNYIKAISKNTKGRNLPPTKSEALGKEYPFCPVEMNYRKAVDLLSKKGILKEVMWNIKSKENKYGSIMTFVVLTPFGRKFIDEKILGPQEQRAGIGSGDIPQDWESVNSNP